MIRAVPRMLCAMALCVSACHALSGLDDYQAAPGAGGASSTSSSVGGGATTSTAGTASSTGGQGGGAGGGGRCAPRPCGDPNVLACMEFEDDLLIGGQLGGSADQVGGTVGFVDGVFGRAVELDGNTFVRLNADSALAPTRPFTIELYLYAAELPNDESGPYMVFDQQSCCSLRLGTNQTLRAEHRFAGATSAPLEAKRWYHVVLVYDDDRVTLFVDGDDTTDDVAPNNIAVEDDLLLGANDNNGAADQRWPGRFDELRIYEGALTPDTLCP